MIHYHNCPACQSAQILSHSEVKDHSVSGETFQVWNCQNCGLRFTQDVPEQEQIGRYYQSDAYVSHTDTNEGIINKLYHSIRKITIRQKRKMVMVESGKKSGRVLDIGCGTGAFLFEMQGAGWDVVGLEPDDTAASIAREKHNLNPRNPQELFSLDAASFDSITMWHVLEHVHTLDAYVAQLNKLMTDKAVLFVAVPNYTSHDAAQYGTAWAAYDVPRHLYHFSPNSMKALMERHGLKIDKIKPMWFDAIYVSMLSEKYYAGKNRLLHALFTGIISNLKALFSNKSCSSLIYVIRKK